MKKRLRLAVQLSIGVVILLWLLQLTDVTKVFSTLLSMNPINIILSATFFIMASVFVALALYVVVKNLDSNISLRKAVMASFAGQLLSDVTPARSGYFLTPLILNKMCGTSTDKGTAGVLLTGVANSFVKVILSALALIYFLKFLPLQQVVINAAIVGMLFLLAGGLSLLAFMVSKRFLNFCLFLNKVPAVKAISQKLLSTLEKTQKEGKKAFQSMPLLFLLILSSIVANAIALIFISNALWCGSPSLLEFIFIAALAGSLMYVPITVAGLGVQETGYVLLLTFLGMPLEKTVAFALTARLLFTGTDAIGILPLLQIGNKFNEK